MQKSFKISSSHDINFDYIIEDNMRCAYENVLLNRKNTFKHRRTGKYKKSPVQSGCSAVVCLLQFIVLESMLRRSFFKINKKDAYSNELWKVFLGMYIGDADSNLGKLKQIYDELILIRHAIGHAYLFEGEIHQGTDYRFLGINEKVVGGKLYKNLKHRKTKFLKICVSPNQIGFRDAAVYYKSTLVLLKSAGIDIRYNLWKWSNSNEELTDEEWLNRSMKSLHFAPSKIWTTLDQLDDEAEYIRFMHL